MSEQSILAGDEVTVTVTKAVPFGVLVEYAGVPGLVRRVQAEPGADLRVRVVEYDVAERRFSAAIA
jgi:hypothetical protein